MALTGNNILSPLFKEATAASSETKLLNFRKQIFVIVIFSENKSVLIIF